MLPVPIAHWLLGVYGVRKRAYFMPMPWKAKGRRIYFQAKYGVTRNIEAGTG
jgi:hypothetical protein